MISIWQCVKTVAAYRARWENVTVQSSTAGWDNAFKKDRCRPVNSEYFLGHHCKRDEH